ncbi:hypothetical protein PLESTB_000990300 [Pleodorina starrii]|uniref:Uncharacterized protein n=1 Tax=Pleodorina starrii TaxID=330485 RepID=A0A9W6F3V5_9CHLO|nr:hypothetical protein PLESTM_000553000 [Pleodorina starrii]GLC55467.1 hypothetical protein PLESTB_000990300 [Pleodorina starrii]GLC73859.1 hypothetical protein PLESTF_001428700 [Pleodorina starrii]
MPLRPEGTDGSDWSYREIVEDRYKRMAVNMSATFFLHQVQSAVLLLKLAWYLIPVFVEERQPDTFIYPFLVCLVVGNICFYAGKPRGRCVLPLMKVAALLVMCTAGLHFVGLWRYHLLDPKTKQVTRRLFKHLKDTGAISSPTWLTVFVALETVLDGAVGLSAGLCFFAFNNWVRDAMDVVREREERNKAAAEAVPIRPPPGALKKRR